MAEVVVRARGVELVMALVLGLGIQEGVAIDCMEKSRSNCQDRARRVP